jgi:membrane protease YdiL (CAAX protease family)
MCTVVLVIASFAAGVYTALFTQLTPGLGANSQFMLFVWLGPFPVSLPFSLPEWFIVLFTLAIYGLLLSYSAVSGERPLSALADSFKNGPSQLMKSDLFVALVSMGFFVYTVTAVDTIISATGASIGAPTGNDIELFVSSLTSPLTEEVGFRMCVIGAVALIMAIGGSRREALASLWRPSRVYENEEVRTGKVLMLGIALLGSSFLFGVAHLGSGWNLGKLPEAVYGGLVLGYLYIRFGLYVSVLAHWGLDFLGNVFAYFGQGVYGIPASSSPGFVLQQVVYYDLLAGIGLFSFVLVTYLGLQRFKPLMVGGSSNPRSS